MKQKDLADKVVAEYPSLPAIKVSRALRVALRTLSEELKTTEAEKIHIKDLGVFRIRTVEVEREGVPTKVRRIHFSPATDKGGKGGKAGKAEATELELDDADTPADTTAAPATAPAAGDEAKPAA